MEPIDKEPLFAIFKDAHFGLGLRWSKWGGFIRVAVAFPFFSIDVAIPCRRNEYGE